MDLTYMMCCYVEFCPTLLSGWSLPRLDQGIAEAKAKSDPSRLEPWVFKKSHCQRSFPFTSFAHIYSSYSSLLFFSCAIKHSKVFFLDRYVPSSWYIYFSICLSDGFKLLNPLLGILSSRNSPSWTLVLLDPKHRRHLHCQQGYGNIKLEHLG